MAIYLGLGSNLGERREQLRRGLDSLTANGVDVLRVSPVVESPALLPARAPADWNRVFLNLVAECRTSQSPEALRETIKRIERAHGREDGDRWSPRPLDIDILVWDELELRTPTLTIPHPDAHTRNFVLTPLTALNPRLRLPGKSQKTVLDWTCGLDDHIPLWMGIVNLTPDSFSDGGRFTDWDSVEPTIAAMLEAGVHIIDLGAESTRPGAHAIDPQAERRRLEPVLEPLREHIADDRLRPLLSIDTYHPETAAWALDSGVDIINDVTGLSNPAMLEIAAASQAEWVAMHSLSVPAVKAQALPADADALATIESWLSSRIEQWTRAGIDLSRIIVDPGIGFGKTALQSLDLLRAAYRLRRYGLRVLIGHSRKSFLNELTRSERVDRDLMTLGMSLALCAQGVDILRVHNVPLHVAAFRGWSHVRAPA